MEAFLIVLAVLVFVVISQIPVFLSIRKQSSFRPRLVQALPEHDIPLEAAIDFTQKTLTRQKGGK